MPAVKKKWPKLNSLVFCFQLLAMRFPVLSPRRFFFPFLQLLDLCVLDTGSLQFSYSILAASALNHMLPVKIEQVTGKQSETYKSPLSEQKIPYCKTYLWILQNHNLHCNLWEIIPLPWIKSWGKDCLLLKKKLL